MVIRDVYKTRNAGMDECRITYNGYALVTAGFVSFVHAVERSVGGAHADAGVHHAERSHRAERIAADITADIDLELLEGIEQTSVRTSGAKYGWTRGNVYIGLEISVLFTEDNFLYHALRILAEKRELFLADDIYSELAAVIFYVRVKLFDDIDFFAFCRKVTDYLFGQRIEAAYLEIRRFIAESLFGILVGNSASDYADFLVVIFNLVDAEVNSFAVAPMLEAFMNIFISIVLVQKMGIMGVLIGSTIALPVKVIYCAYISDKKVMNRSCKKTIVIYGLNYLFFFSIVFASRFIKLRINTFYDLIFWGVIITVVIGIAGGTINMIANPNLLKWLTNSYLRKKSENKSSYKL